MSDADQARMATFMRDQARKLQQANAEKTKETAKWMELYANMYANFATQPNINLVEPHQEAKVTVAHLLGDIAHKRVRFGNDGSDLSGCSVAVQDKPT